jgi:hypothetical protein
LHCAGRRYLCSGIARPGFPSAEVIRGRFHLLPITIKLTGLNLLTARCRCGSGRPGRPITPFEYSWVSDFAEGRAIVAKNGKMGAINSDGKKVIPVIYKTLEFDIETGIFTATNDKYHYIIDYEGKIIRRTKIESEVANATKEEYHIVNF